jgi:hypothetical protein
MFFGIATATFVHVVPLFGETPSGSLISKLIHVATMATVRSACSFGLAAHDLLHRHFETIVS